MMISRGTIYAIIIAFVLAQGMFSKAMAQTYHTKSGRALRAYTDGKRAYDYRDYKTAEKKLLEAAEIDDGFYEAFMMLAELFYDQKQYTNAVLYYRKAIAIDSLLYMPVYYYLGVSEFNSGLYYDALESFKLFLSLDTGSEKMISETKKLIVNCEFGIVAINSPVPFDPVNMGDSVNSGFNEYSPSITADGTVLMFTRELEARGNEYFSGRKHEDFYISYRNEDGIWSKAVNAGPPLNTPGNEGAQTIGAGGQYMFFTACDRPGGHGRCDIYFSSFDGRNWSDPVNIGGPVNTVYWESQPSISADGRTLYFVSNRPGGVGGLDIWVSKMGDDSKWGEPYNIGEPVNTAGDEVTPFIHFDGKTMYYSSNGKPNLGGFDIYVTRLQDNDKWSDPVNLGYPVNTHHDEIGLTIESNGYRAYYSSTSHQQRIKNLYYFDLHEEARPGKVSYLRGRVYDMDTRRSLRVRYDLTNLTTGESAGSSFTNNTGQFLVCLPSGYNYGLNISAQGYLFYSENFPFDGEHTEYKPLVKDIFLNKIRKGESLIMYNVLFDVNSSELLNPSITELNKLYQILDENKGVTIEIGGHTDNTGSDEFNQKLSEERAKAVMKYLTDKGINQDRLTAKGYGKTMPVKDNSTIEGRRLNRRTEIRIIDM